MAKKDVNVPAHLKPSLGKVVGTYTRNQEVADDEAGGGDRRPPSESLHGLAGARTPAAKLAFPLDAYKPPKRGFLRRLRDRFDPVVTLLPGRSFGERYSWTYREINRRGEGYVYCDEIVSPGHWPKALCEPQRIGPNIKIGNSMFLRNKDYSRTNMPRLETTTDIKDVNWSGANLTGARFTARQAALLDNVNFDGANLTGAHFTGVSLSQVTMRGADLTGVEFDRVRAWLRAEDGFMVDVTDTNITEQQFDTLRKQVSSQHPDDTIRIRRYSLDEVAELTGIDKDELAVSIWAGDISYRTRRHDEKVDGDPFDADTHYIPQWEPQRLLNTGGT